MHTDGADSPNNRAPNVSVVGRDSVMLPDEAESLLTDTGTLGVAETSEVRYSKRPSGSPPHFSFLRFYQYTTGSMPRTEPFPRRRLLPPVILS